MRFLYKSVLAVMSLILLSGCAGMSGKFGCDATAGDSCTPVSKVNAQADAGAFDHVSSGGSDYRSENQTFSYADSTSVATRGGYQGETPIPGEPVRFGERVQRIWIAPYQDLSNNYHEPSYVYTVLNKSHWIGVPANEIKTSETEQED